MGYGSVASWRWHRSAKKDGWREPKVWPEVSRRAGRCEGQVKLDVYVEEGV